MGITAANTVAPHSLSIALSPVFNSVFLLAQHFSNSEARRPRGACRGVYGGGVREAGLSLFMLNW